MGISQQIGSSSLSKPGVCTSSTRPATPYEGQMIYETDTDKVLAWNGSAWVIPNSPAQNPQGLELIKTATVTSSTETGAAFQSIFSSTYTSYRIVCRSLTSVANGSLPRMTFYYGTSTEQITLYYSAVINVIYTGTSSITAVSNGTHIGLGAACDNLGSSTFSMDIHNIGSSTNPNCVVAYADGYSGAWSHGGGLINVSRAYTGVNFKMSTGNIAMVASVYGYRNS